MRSRSGVCVFFCQPEKGQMADAGDMPKRKENEVERPISVSLSNLQIYAIWQSQVILRSSSFSSLSCFGLVFLFLPSLWNGKTSTLVFDFAMEREKKSRTENDSSSSFLHGSRSPSFSASLPLRSFLFPCFCVPFSSHLQSREASRFGLLSHQT